MEYKKKKRTYRICLLLLLLITTFGAIAILRNTINKDSVRKYWLYSGKKSKINLSKIPGSELEMRESSIAVNNTLNKSITLRGEKEGSYEGRVKMFGVIPCAKVKVNVVKETKVVPMGNAVGIYLESKGIMVLGSEEILGADGLIHHPGKDRIKPGDYIDKVNGKKILTIAKLSDFIVENGGKEILFTLRRKGKKKEVSILPIKGKDGTYQIGLWLREDTEGIGTLTCIKEDGTFVGLGHGIEDVDTGKLISLGRGGLYHASITNIVPGEEGKPGELRGAIELSGENKIGEVSKNREYGIMGTLKEGTLPYQKEKSIPVGLKQDIRPGKAKIYCQLGEAVGEYEIMIERVNLKKENGNGISIRVTDQELLKKTGGIIQGMSGSPIIQNGKLVGAVTHVFVDDPTRGYGIFIEEMLEEN